MGGMKRFSPPLKFGVIFLLFIIGIIFRVIALPAISADMKWYLFPWYDFLKQHGAQGLAASFSNYTPPYLYLLWLATLTSNVLPKILAIKSFSIVADIINSFLIYRIVRLKYPTGSKPLLAGVIFWALPTVMVNSSLWGQADSIYIIFLMACLYFLLINKPVLGVFAFSAAFAIKAQAFFLFPVLMILFFRKRFPWYFFLLIPLIYALFCLPAVLLGQGWLAVFTIYLFQSTYYHELSKHAPNLYIFMNSFPYNLGVALGLAFAGVAISCWVWLSIRSKSELDLNRILFISLVSVALTPFILPKMLDRYFYPADVLSLVAAFYFPEIWFIPILYQLISGSAYLVSLFDAPLALIKVAALINTAAICFLLWRQFQAPVSSGQALVKDTLT